MTAIQLLPIVEHWECRSCARCCHGSVIHLDDKDLAKLRQQRWEQHPDFQGISTVVRESWLGNRHRLAQRPDGACVFLTAEGRCRIHEEFGLEAKPLTCRMFPLQLVPREKGMVLTVRRACPTAAAESGPALKTYLKQCRAWAEDGELLQSAARVPRVTRRDERNWNDFLIVASALEKLLSDERYPLVRRIVHGLRFCSLLEECKLRRLDGPQLKELVQVLSENAFDVGDLFRDRPPPEKAAATLFRQTAADYVRLHHRYVPDNSWKARWKLARVAVAFARGKGPVPHRLSELPDVDFESLEQPLGHLEEVVQRPFVRFFESHAASLQYTLVNRPSWSLIESYRALALTFPIGLWLLRLLSAGRKPVDQDAIDVITILDRGQGYAPLASSQHRSRVRVLSSMSAIETLAAWYAR